MGYLFLLLPPSWKAAALLASTPSHFQNQIVLTFPQMASEETMTVSGGQQQHVCSL